MLTGIDQQFWSNRGEIQNSTAESASLISQESSLEQWKARGDELLRKHHYQQAKECYENAQRPHEEAIANAYILRELANQTVPSAKSSAFNGAAQAFLKCAREPSNGYIRMPLLKMAAECLEYACEAGEAAHTYVLAGCFDEAIKLQLECKDYTSALTTFLRYDGLFLPGTDMEYRRRLGQHFFVERDFR